MSNQMGHMRNLPNNGRGVAFQVFVHPTLKSQFKAYCATKQQSMSDIAREMIQEYLDEKDFSIAIEEDPQAQKAQGAAVQ